MSGHVTDRLGDILAGRLNPAELHAVEEHMKECRDCASEIAWARKLRDRALREGVRHVSASRIVELGRSPSSATSDERAHLDACAECGGELHWVEGRPATAEAGESLEGTEEDPAGETATPIPGGSARPRRARTTGWVFAGLAAAAVVVVLLVPRGEEPDLSGLARLDPLPVRIDRSIPDPESFEEHRLLGVEAYAGAEYGKATAHLESALDLRPEDAETLLYLGSARLLQRDPSGAVPILERARAAADEAGLSEEAAWQLAQALLLARRTLDAERLLEDIASGGGHRGKAAGALLESMQEVR